MLNSWTVGACVHGSVYEFESVGYVSPAPSLRFIPNQVAGLKHKLQIVALSRQQQHLLFTYGKTKERMSLDNVHFSYKI